MMLSELVGEEELCIQVLKLLEDNCKAPEQLVSDDLLLMLSISSENVTEMGEDGEVMVAEFDGEVEVTIGAVVSISKKLILSVTESFDALSLTVIVQSV